MLHFKVTVVVWSFLGPDYWDGFFMTGCLPHRSRSSFASCQTPHREGAESLLDIPVNTTLLLMPACSPVLILSCGAAVPSGLALRVLGGLAPPLLATRGLPSALPPPPWRHSASLPRLRALQQHQRVFIMRLPVVLQSPSGLTCTFALLRLPRLPPWPARARRHRAPPGAASVAKACVEETLATLLNCTNRLGTRHRITVCLCVFSSELLATAAAAASAALATVRQAAVAAATAAAAAMAAAAALVFSLSAPGTPRRGSKLAHRSHLPSRCSGAR